MNFSFLEGEIGSGFLGSLVPQRMICSLAAQSCGNRSAHAKCR